LAKVVGFSKIPRVTSSQASSFGEALKRALSAADKNQAWLAGQLGVHPGQVSRWSADKALPHPKTVAKIEKLLDTSFRDARRPEYDLYISAPITALTNIAAHGKMVEKVVTALEKNVPGILIYTPTQHVLSRDQAPDIALERNMEAFARSKAYLYLQFERPQRPTGALIELGMALGRKMKTTIMIQDDVDAPFMLEDGFQGVAVTSSILPLARVYRPKDVGEVERLIASTGGRTLLGLD